MIQGDKLRYLLKFRDSQVGPGQNSFAGRLLVTKTYLRLIMFVDKVLNKQKWHPT